MLGSASSSLPSYPGHPPAANEGLMSLVPDFILGPRKALDFGELQQPGRRGTTRFFGTRSKVSMDWAASAIKPGRRSLNRTSMDGRRARHAQKDPTRAECHDVEHRGGVAKPQRVVSTERASADHTIRANRTRRIPDAATSTFHIL